MKRILISLLAIVATLGSDAAEPFVSFKSSADVMSLQGASVSFDSREHSCVQRAVANLQQDFEKVTQKGLPLAENARILVGTVGVNKQIDQWVKKGTTLHLFNLAKPRFIHPTVRGGDGERIKSTCLTVKPMKNDTICQ